MEGSPQVVLRRQLEFSKQRYDAWAFQDVSRDSVVSHDFEWRKHVTVQAHACPIPLKGGAH